MRELIDHKVNGLNEALTVNVLDEPGAGGANHVYEIKYDTGGTGGKVMTVAFQNGPIKEAGVNGVSHEALLAILIDRLRGFQAGQYACRDNAIALTELENALMRLQKRTSDRLKRGVEGTSAK